MLKLKLQYFGHLMQRTDSLEKTLKLERLKAGEEGDSRGWDGWMASPTQWTWVWVNSRSWWWTGRPGMLQSMGSQRVRHDWVIELNWCLQQKFCIAKIDIFTKDSAQFNSLLGISQTLVLRLPQALENCPLPRGAIYCLDLMLILPKLG